MKQIDQEAITILRGQGLGYGAIAARLQIPEGTIKSYCSRNGLKAQTPSRIPSGCQHCGAPLAHTPGRKPKKFCSSACRAAWWNSHLRLVNRKAYYEITCAHCGTVFQSYGNKGRRFCCHPCYIAHRFNPSEKGTPS